MLISAIMPTRARASWVWRAVESWERQTHLNRELVIIDDADAPSFPDGIELDGVQYHLIERRLTIGAKRNLACSRALGDALCHWDDDDEYGPGRMADQLARLLASGKPITGYNSARFVDESGRVWQYRGASNYALGASLMYRRDFWQSHPFPDRNVGEDNDFIFASRGQIATADAGDFLVASIHSGNTSRRDMNPDAYTLISEPACA